MAEKMNEQTQKDWNEKDVKQKFNNINLLTEKAKHQLLGN